MLRWLHPSITTEQQNDIVLPAGAAWAIDTEERTVILFTSEWSNNYFIEKNSKIALSEIPFVLQTALEQV